MYLGVQRTVYLRNLNSSIMLMEGGEGRIRHADAGKKNERGKEQGPIAQIRTANLEKPFCVFYRCT